MAENENIAKVAEKAFTEIFSIFGWEQAGPRNQNWACVHAEGHANISAHSQSDPVETDEANTDVESDGDTNVTPKKTHPSDVVFHYTDPYSAERIYVNVDLKSFGKSTIQKAKIRKALYDLSYSVDCANLSNEWATLYADGVNDRKTIGMLFIYNHDNKQDLSKYERFVKAIDPAELPLAGGRTLILLGPPEINYLLTIANDIERSRGREKDGCKEMPSSNECYFYYPDLISAHPSLHGQKAASIEMLVSPWQIIRFDKVLSNVNHTYYYFYYRGTGDSVDEFKYIFDYFFRYNLLDDHVLVSIRMPYPSEKAAAYFTQAKDAYAKHFYSLGEFRKRLDRISFDTVTRVIASFDITKIGMDGR